MVQCYSECISIKIYVFIRRNQTSFLWILDADWLSRATLTWFSQNRYFHLFISAPRHDNTYVKLHRKWLIQKKYNEYHPFTQHFFFIFLFLFYASLFLKDMNIKYVHVVLAPSFCGENYFFLKIVRKVKIFWDFRASDVIKSCEQTGVNSFFLCRTCYGICCFWL